MDLDDMKQLWKTLEVRVARVERTVAVDRTRGAVRGAIAAEIGKLVAWLAFLAFAIPVIADVPIAGGSIAAYAVVAIVLGALQLRAAARVDYAAAIVALQRELVALDRLRAGCSLALGLPWWLLWIAFPVVAAAWAGIDLFRHARSAILANVAIGAAGLAISIVVARYLARRPIRSPHVQRLVDSLAGTRIKRAARELGDVAKFAE